MKLAEGTVGGRVFSSQWMIGVLAWRLVAVVTRQLSQTLLLSQMCELQSSVIHSSTTPLGQDISASAGRSQLMKYYYNTGIFLGRFTVGAGKLRAGVVLCVPLPVPLAVA